MIADESLVTLNGLKKYDQRKGTAVIEANELPASPLNKVYNVGDDVYSKDVKLSTYQQMLDEVDKVTVDENTQDANRNIISKAVLDVNTLPSTIGDKVYREETSTTQTTTFTFRYGMTRTEIEALGFVYDQEASSTTAQVYRWPETAGKTEISFKIGTGSYIYKLTANTLDYNTSTGNYRVYVPAEQGGPQYYITSLDANKDYNFTVKETTYSEVKVYAKDTELATKEYADKFIPLTQKAVANGVATLDANGHVPVEQMPTQALIFQGYWDASTGSLPAAGTVSGDFYIVSVEGTVSGVIYRPGDWIIWDGSAWTLSRNTNAVASVNGQTGAVTLDGSNIQATYEGTTDTINNLLTQVGKVKTVNSQTPDVNGNILLDGSNIQATYEGTTDTINTLLTQVGKVKTVNNQSPDANGNIQIDLSSTTTGVTEETAMSNIGTDANASQHDINAAIDSEFASHTWSINNWTLSYS